MYVCTHHQTTHQNYSVWYVCVCVYTSPCVCVYVCTHHQNTCQKCYFFFFTFAVTINYLLHTLTFLHTVIFFFCLCGHDILLITYCNLFTYCYPFFFYLCGHNILLITYCNLIHHTIYYTTYYITASGPSQIAWDLWTTKWRGSHELLT